MNTKTIMNSRDVVFQEDNFPFKSGSTGLEDTRRNLPLPVVPLTLDEESKGMTNDSKELPNSTTPVSTRVDEDDTWNVNASDD